MKKHFIALSIGVAVVFGVFSIAHANPSFFPTPITSSAATSTTSFITPGAGTTTLVYDSYVPGTTLGVESATLLVQQQASSTASVLNFSVQYSPDAIDWYDDNLSVGTTGPSVSIQSANSLTWLAASTARTNKAIGIKTPLRYTRVVITGTGANSSIWAAVVPKREKSE